MSKVGEGLINELVAFRDVSLASNATRRVSAIVRPIFLASFLFGLKGIYQNLKNFLDFRGSRRDVGFSDPLGLPNVENVGPAPD